jgi:DNA-binding transcriptional LysR family regulator
MDIELLRTFLEVNRTRHFGKAADTLCVTQAAVSARIKQLEGVLDTPLFERSRKEVKLTPEGHRLKGHAERILADWNKARQEVTAGGARNQLSVSSSPRLWDILLQRWLLDLRRFEPDLAIITHSVGQEGMTRQLIDGAIDLAFMLDPPNLESLQVQELAPLRLTLVASEPDLSHEEAMDDRFIYIDWGPAHNLELQRAFPDAQEPLTRLASARIGYDYLRALGGSAYLPLAMVGSSLRRKKLFRIPGAPVFEREAYAVYHVRSTRLALITRALSFFVRRRGVAVLPP